MSNAAAKTHPTVTHACRVTAIQPLSADTFQVDLQSTSNTALHYHAGQHLQLNLDVNGDGQLQPLLYSIANGPYSEQPQRLELIIQNNSGFAEKVLKRLTQLNKSQANTNVTLPLGQAYLQTDLHLRHLLIAAGSGISKIKCLTEEILRQHPHAHVDIYWSNKQADDFYLDHNIRAWTAKNKHLHFTPILETAHANWPGRSGYIYKVIEEDFASLEGVQAYLCGSPQMVYGTIDKLQPRGLQEANCYSDVFEYAPRT